MTKQGIARQLVRGLAIARSTAPNAWVSAMRTWGGESDEIQGFCRCGAGDRARGRVQFEQQKWRKLSSDVIDDVCSIGRRLYGSLRSHFAVSALHLTLNIAAIAR